jgi:cytochrome P450
MSRVGVQNAIVNFAAHPLAWPFQMLMRPLGPIRHVPGIGIIISGAEVAREVLLRDAEFTKNGPGGFAEVITQVLGPTALSNMDGAPHRALRTKLTDVLSPSRVEAMMLRSCMPELERLRERLLAGETVDLVEFMETLSGSITCDMMGVTPGVEAREVYREMVHRGARVAKAIGIRPLAEERLRAVHADCDWLWEFARPSYENAVDATLIGRLRTAGLDFEEARGVLLLIFLAGTLTTAAALPRLVGLLLDSGQMPMLQRDPSRALRAVDEGLRYLAPVPATTRIARSTVSVGGMTVPAGTRVIVLTGNLTRDRALFPDPDRFNVERTHDPRAKHLWYGAGPHFCFGFPLAQRELTLVLETLASLPRPIRLVSRRPAWGATIPAYASFRIVADRGRA